MGRPLFSRRGVSAFGIIAQEAYTESDNAPARKQRSGHARLATALEAYRVYGLRVSDTYGSSLVSIKDIFYGSINKCSKNHPGTRSQLQIIHR